MEIVKLVVQKRHHAGKGVARRLRRAGQLPAVVYGNGITVAIALAEKDLTHIQQSEAGENTILDFVIEGDTPESCQAILREVPLTFINEPHNLLQSANAVLAHLWREVEVACLPGDIPDEITVDLAHIHPGATFKAGALALPPGVTLVTDAEEVIVTAHVEVEAPAASSPEEVEA